MSVYHDEIEIEDMEYDEETETYYYPCPCGDKFQISKEELESGEDVAKCPSCSLLIKVIYDPEFLSEGPNVRIARPRHQFRRPTRQKVEALRTFKKARKFYPLQRLNLPLPE